MNLYEILGISTTASKSEIKKAYYEKAKQFHPDHGIASNDESFREIAQAYEILMNDERREQYDATGFVNEKEFDSKKIAYNTISLMFQRILDVIEDMFTTKVNIIDLMKQHMKQDIDVCERRIVSSEKKIKLLEKVQKKIKIKKKRDNIDFMNSVIHKEMNKYTDSIVQARFQIEVDNLIIDILGDYEFENEE